MGELALPWEAELPYANFSLRLRHVASLRSTVANPNPNPSPSLALALTLSSHRISLTFRSIVPGFEDGRGAAADDACVATV